MQTDHILNGLIVEMIRFRPTLYLLLFEGTALLHPRVWRAGLGEEWRRCGRQHCTQSSFSPSVEVVSGGHPVATPFFFLCADH